MKSSLYRDSQESKERDNYIRENPQRNFQVQDRQVDFFLDEFPEYWEYLKHKRPDLPEFPYGFFAELCRFTALEYKNGNTVFVERIFVFFEKMGKSDDTNVLNLLLIGCFESFGYQKDVLPELVELMPKNLKVLFLEHFGEYLK